MIKKCSVFGHSTIEITKEIESNLFEIIENLIINENVDTFYFGGLGQFDDLCYKIVSKLKIKYKHIIRIYALENPNWIKEQKRPQRLKNEEYEEVIYLDLKFDYWYNRIYFRNCEIINRSDFTIIYVRNKENSGAYKALKYAQKKKKQIILI